MTDDKRKQKINKKALAMVEAEAAKKAELASLAFNNITRKVYNFFYSVGEYATVKDKLPGLRAWFDATSEKFTPADYFAFNNQIPRIMEILTAEPDDPERYKWEVIMDIDGTVFFKLLEIESEKDTSEFFNNILTKAKQASADQVMRTTSWSSYKWDKEKSYMNNSFLLNAARGRLDRKTGIISETVDTGELVNAKIGSLDFGKKEKTYYAPVLFSMTPGYQYFGRPLSEFDAEVLDALYSLWRTGRHIVTPESVYIEMTALEPSATVPKKILKSIIESIEKLRNTNLKVTDLKAYQEFLKNTGRNPNRIPLGGVFVLLWDTYTRTTGGPRPAYIFGEEQVIFENEDLMDQIIPYPRKYKLIRYIDGYEKDEKTGIITNHGTISTRVRMTEGRLTIRRNLLHHVLQIANGKYHNDTIDIISLYAYGEVDRRDRTITADAREFIELCLKYWQHPDIGFIAGYKPVTKRKGRYNSITGYTIIKIKETIDA